MDAYKHILLAMDFSDHSENVADRAADLAAKYRAELSVIYVVDNVPLADSMYGPVFPFEGDIISELLKTAKTRLAEFGEKLSIPAQRQWVEAGRPVAEIIRVAEEESVDLIVVGSHGRHGLGLLLGSTANGVLHHAICDVVAVRLQDK